MKFVILLMAGLTALGTFYTYISAEVPGGEKRYEQFMRQMGERHSLSDLGGR
jgi:hypothetical protein